MVHSVKDMKDFEEQLDKAGGKLVVVDFFATWYVYVLYINLKTNSSIFPGLAFIMYLLSLS